MKSVVVVGYERYDSLAAAANLSLAQVGLFDDNHSMSDIHNAYHHAGVLNTNCCVRRLV